MEKMERRLGAYIKALREVFGNGDWHAREADEWLRGRGSAFKSVADSLMDMRHEVALEEHAVRTMKWTLSQTCQFCGAGPGEDCPCTDEVPF